MKFSQILSATGTNGKTIKIEFVWIKNDVYEVEFVDTNNETIDVTEATGQQF